MPAPLHPLAQAGQEPGCAVQADWHLRNEDEVDVVAGQRRVTGDESRMPAHQLDEADAVRDRTGLRVRGLDGIGGASECGLETKAVADVGNVIVAGLRPA